MVVPYVLAFVSLEFIRGALRIGVISLGLGLLASLVLVPFLLNGRLRSLFATVGPTDHWMGNYPIIMTIVGGGEIALFALTVELIAIEYANPATVEQLVLSASVALLLGCILVLSLLPLVVFPRLGIDWDRNGYDARTIGLVCGAVLWYHAGTILLSPYTFDWIPSPLL